MAIKKSTGGRVALALAIVAQGLFVLGPGLACFEIVPAMIGFSMFGVAGLLAVITVAIGGITAVRNGLSAARPGLVVGSALVVGFLLVAMPGCGVPRINDITTDMAKPPQFVHAGTLPANAGRDMAYPGESFAAQQREAYPDIAPLELAADPAVVLAAAERVARATPRWEVTRVDAPQGAIEGVATTLLFHFKDDFVVTVAPGAGGGSIVQMRSKSRDGKSDIGANAKRIRDYFARLQAELGGS
jgi:uncharacterized protein (DUF1499 family)